MVTRGRVENGIIVFDSGIKLPEGAEVTVIFEPASAGKPTEQLKRHSVLDIPAYNTGKMLKPLTSDDDILGEMLEGRF